MAKDNPLAAGALAAILLGTGTGREVAGGALKLGGLAAVAGLAYKAYQNYQSGKAPAEAAQSRGRRTAAASGRFKLPSGNRAAGRA